jgi:hypothetical protein
VLKLPHHQNKICHHYFIITKIKATLLNVITNTGVAPSKTPAPAILRRLGTVVAVAAVGASEVGASEVVVAAVAARLEASALALLWRRSSRGDIGGATDSLVF